MKQISEQGKDHLLFAGIIFGIPAALIIGFVVFGIFVIYPAYEKALDKVSQSIAQEQEQKAKGYKLMLDLDNVKVVRIYNDNGKSFITELEGQGFSITDTRHFEPWSSLQSEYTDVEMHKEVSQ